MSDLKVSPVVLIEGVAMVRADHVASSTIEAFAKPKRSKVEKEAGVSVALSKARAYAGVGVNPALLASYGVNRNANLSVVQASHVAALVAGEQVRFDLAMRQVCAAAQITANWELELLADGGRVAKRADWLKLQADLIALQSAPDVTKAGAKRYAVALQLWADIQTEADKARARAVAQREADKLEMSNT